MCCAVLNHFSHVQLFVTLWPETYQAPLSRQEDWSGCHALLFQHGIPIFIGRHFNLQRAGPEFYGRNIPFLTEPDMEATVRKRQGITGWFKIGKRVRQSCILSPLIFNLYTEYIMRNARLDEAQAGIKIARRNINTSNMQMTPPLCRKWSTKKPLDESERGEWKSWLKAQHLEN